MASSTVAKSLSVLKVPTLTLPATHGKIAFRDNHIMMYAKNITYILILFFVTFLDFRFMAMFLRDMAKLQSSTAAAARIMMYAKNITYI
jgi:hypothetical protein